MTFWSGWKLHGLDIQRVGLDFKYNLFVPPVPNRKGVVWCTCYWCKIVGFETKIHTVLTFFGTTPQYAVYFRFIFNHFLNLNIRPIAFFSDCKLHFVLTDTYTADSIAIFAFLELKFHVTDVQHLEIVTVRGYDQRGVQAVQILVLLSVHSKVMIETRMFGRNWGCIAILSLNFIIRIIEIFIQCFSIFILSFYFIRNFFLFFKFK